MIHKPLSSLSIAGRWSQRTPFDKAQYGKLEVDALEDGPVFRDVHQWVMAMVDTAWRPVGKDLRCTTGSQKRRSKTAMRE